MWRKLSEEVTYGRDYEGIMQKLWIEWEEMYMEIKKMVVVIKILHEIQVFFLKIEDFLAVLKI